MSVPDNVSYFSRFLVKFVEIIAAGLATAASGYLIAHLSGVWSSPPPARATAVFPAPNESILSGLPAPPAQSAQPTAPVTAPISADINQKALAPAPEPNAARPAQTSQPARPAASKAAPAAKHNENAAKETTRDQDSLAAQVRAALANANANRSESPPDSAPHGGAPHEPLAQPRPLSDPIKPAAVSAAPPAAPGPQPAPVQETPVETNPLTTEEITSHPVAGVQPPPEPPDKETGVLSKLDHLLREDPLAGAQEAPRPPMPVGE
jgi:hypothetical protein